MATSTPSDQNGRALGPKARRTRTRLLETTAALLEHRGLRELTVAEIARRAGTSPATFYQYFPDVEGATLALAERAAEASPRLAGLLHGPFTGPAGLETARAVVVAFVEHWDTHRAVLRVRNLEAAEGNAPFAQLRARVLAPALEQLAKRIEESRTAGLVAHEIDSHAAAAAMLAVLERLSDMHEELEAAGIAEDALVETSARILHQTVAGRGPEDGPR